MDSTAAHDEGRMVDLGRYARAARRRWPEILLLGIVGGVAGYFLLPSPTYQSSAVVQVASGLVSLAQGGGATSGPNMSTEQQVAKSESVVAQALADTPGGLSVSQFQQQATVSSPPSSTTMTFTFTGPDAEAAQAGATAWAQAYLTSRERELSTVLDRNITQMQAQVRSLRERQRTTEARVAATTDGTIDRRQARNDLRSVNSQLRSAEGQLGSLNTLTIDAGSVITRPLLPRQPSGLTGPMGAVLGALAGLLAGLVLALGLERFSNRLRDARDLPRATSAPVWATVRDSEADDGRAYEAVAARLLLRVRHDGLRTVLVTSADRSVEEDVLRLATALERLGHPVEVTTDVAGLLAETEGAPDGSASADRLVVVAAPPVADDPRAAVLAAEADAVLLLAETGRSAVSELRTADELLSAAGAAVTGVLLRQVPRRRRRSAAKAASVATAAAGAVERSAAALESRADADEADAEGADVPTPAEEAPAEDESAEREAGGDEPAGEAPEEPPSDTESREPSASRR